MPIHCRLLFGGIRCAIADYNGMQISTDLSDILFGTPRLVRTYANLGALKEDAVNIAIHGHNPVLSEVIVDVARKMDEEARQAGASGINIVGICCTGTEALMRKGVSLASNFASQELALATGAVDLLVADYQCIMPSLSEICSCMHTEMVTTMSNVRIPYDTHVQFREEDAEESARSIIRMAIKSFQRREPAKVKIPNVSYDVVAGFSTEQIEELCAPFVPEDPLIHIVEAIRSGQIRGIALLAGCNNQKAVQDRNHLTIAKEMIKHDVLVLTTGCSAGACAKNDLLSAEATERFAGPGLKTFIRSLEERNGVKLPPIWHMGSCVDNSRAANLAKEIAVRLGTDVSEIPFIVSAPEANHEKAVSIGTWCVALGMPVHVGTISYVHGSSLVTEVLEHSARDVFGGHFIFEADPHKASHRLLNTIERRRWMLSFENHYVVEDSKKLSNHRLFRMAIDGALIATGFADQLLGVAIEKHGYDKKIEYPETAYELPSIYAWDGSEAKKLGDLPGILGKARGKIRETSDLESALVAGEATMIAAEIIESLKYLDDARPYEGTMYMRFRPGPHTAAAGTGPRRRHHPGSGGAGRHGQGPEAAGQDRPGPAERRAC